MDNSSLAVGAAISHYKIISQLGVGGMGEVYLAQDTTELDRTVALKILPVEVAANKDRLQRFTQEARTVSNLNHPNILTIYEFGQADSVCFIATEFIDGETLRKHLSRRRLKLVDVLDIAAQIVAALDAAHEAGVVHRDIKPENVMLRRDHIVKVLDFGLAKPGGKPGTSSVDSEAGTKVRVHTEPGVVMGTVSYMSPEQSLGSDVDHRTDIWSAGVLLYEMLAGVVPFEGKDIHRQVIAIQEQEPAPLSHHVEGVPARLEEIVVKCLAKEKDERYQTARDLLIDLRNLKRRLDVDAEIERTVAPEFRTTSGGASQGGRTSKQSSQPGAGPTNAVPARMTSSAEYLVGQVQQHKTTAVIAAGVLVLAIAAIAYYLHARNTEVAIESIAVLPFENQNRDPSTDYLSDGVTESIINSLTQLPNLRVIARSSVFRYKGKEIDPLAVGKELGVRAVLVGRILQRGDSLAISTELVDVRDNKQLWGQQYNRRLSDLLTMQEEIAKQLKEKLRLKLSGEEEKQLSKRYTANTEAYQSYLKGRYYWNKRSEEGFTKGAQYFQQAIDQDPNYALAYAGLADCYTLLGDYTYQPPGDALPRARAAASKALEIDDSLAEGHASLAHVKMLYDWDWPAVELEFKRSIQLNPGYATAHQWYALFLTAMNRMDEAVAEQKRAQELDPLSLIINTDVGLFSYFNGQSDAAIAQCEKTLELNQNFVPAHFVMGLAYEQKGQFTSAIAEFKKAVDLSSGNALMKASLAHAYAVAGMKGDALSALEELNLISKQHYVSPYEIAVIYAGLAEKDKAFEQLEKALQERSVWLIHLNLRVDPRLSTLRSDPRFADLVRRVGLAQ